MTLPGRIHVTTGGTCLAWWVDTGNTSRQSHWISAPGSRPWSLEVHPQHCRREVGNVWAGGGPSYILRLPMQLHELQEAAPGFLGNYGMYGGGGGGELTFLRALADPRRRPRPQETSHRDSHFVTNSFLANSGIVARRSVIRCSSQLTPERPMRGSAFSVITSDRRAQRQ